MKGIYCIQTSVFLTTLRINFLGGGKTKSNCKQKQHKISLVLKQKLSKIKKDFEIVERSSKNSYSNI